MIKREECNNDIELTPKKNKTVGYDSGHLFCVLYSVNLKFFNCCFLIDCLARNLNTVVL